MSIKVTNNCEEIKEKLRNAVLDAQKEWIKTGVAELTSNAPVKSGDTKRAVGAIKENSSTKIKTVFGVDKSIVYAKKVEYVGKSKGWFRRTIRNVEFENILIKHLKGVK